MVPDTGRSRRDIQDQYLYCYLARMLQLETRYQDALQAAARELRLWHQPAVNVELIGMTGKGFSVS